MSRSPQHHDPSPYRGTDPDPDRRHRLAAAWSGVRRAVLRHRRLLAALCVGAAVFASLRSVSPAPEPTVDVLVAAHDIRAGSVLGRDDLVTTQWPPDVVPAGMATSSEALGRTVTGPVRSGEPVTQTRLVDSSLLEGYPGLEAVPVRVPDQAAASLLRVGDRIDLLATDQRGGETTRVGEDLPVLALPRSGGSGGENRARGALVVVGAAPEMSGMLASAAVSQHLTVAISR